MNRVAQETGSQNYDDEEPAAETSEKGGKKKKNKKSKKKTKKEKKDRKDMSDQEIKIEDKKDKLREIYDCLMFS